ncbi:MAG: DJ-1/PfpI family protein [Candidatus Ancillula sp.]|jgi:putative intracellular protease/amidase|nr:DJ-1/PfpI family protein [Candidatus Ancillula sp.]
MVNDSLDKNCTNKVDARVGIMLVDGCEDVETFGAIDVYQRCGFHTTTVSLEAADFSTASSSPVVRTKCGIKLEPDELYSMSYKLDAFDIVHIPGGGILPSYLDSRNSKNVVDFMNAVVKHVESGGILAANCIAPAILAKTGVLKKLGVKKATSYAGGKDFIGDKFHELFKSDVDWTGNFEESPNSTVVIVCQLPNGAVITANGPGATLEHAFRTASLICGEEIAQKQAKDMVVDISRGTVE